LRYPALLIVIGLILIPLSIRAYDVQLKEIPEVRVASLEYSGPFHMFTDAREQLLSAMAEAGVKPQGHCLVIIHDYPKTSKEGKTGRFSATICYPIGDATVAPDASFQVTILNSGTFLFLTYQGEYNGILEAYKVLLDEAWKQDYLIVGDFREILITPAGIDTPPTVEVELGVQKRTE
jgi:effector-binding domain-containing protein